MMLVLNYPHFRPSFEPRRLRAPEIWALGEAARRQIAGAAQKPKLDLARLIARSRRLQVNGLAFETHWELGRAITDDAGNPALGVLEHDESWPAAALISLNGALIEEREDLARSTAGHELGHAVFETPAWIQRSRQPSLRLELNEPAPERRFQPVATGGAAAKAAAGVPDWREWRANEFMGALLAPRPLLHRHMFKRAAALGIPMIAPERGHELPLLAGRKAGFEATETLAIDLAEIFGVSIDFIQVRLRKYGLISGR
jgi:hypothetical protein